MIWCKRFILIAHREQDVKEATGWRKRTLNSISAARLMHSILWKIIMLFLNHVNFTLITNIILTLLPVFKYPQ